MNPSLPRYVDEREAAAILGLKRGTLANWRSQRRGPKYQRPGGGRFIRYRVDVLIAWAEEITVTPELDSRQNPSRNGAAR